MVVVICGMLVALVLAVGVVALVAVPARREGRDFLTVEGEERVQVARERTSELAGTVATSVASAASSAVDGVKNVAEQVAEQVAERRAGEDAQDDQAPAASGAEAPAAEAPGAEAPADVDVREPRPAAKGTPHQG